MMIHYYNLIIKLNGCYLFQIRYVIAPLAIVIEHIKIVGAKNELNTISHW